jgi:hypothetical protein
LLTTIEWTQSSSHEVGIAQQRGQRGAMLQAVAVVARSALRTRAVAPVANRFGIVSVLAASFHSSLPAPALARNLHPLADPTPTLVVEAALDIAIGPKGKNVPGKPPQGQGLNEHERLVRRLCRA